MSAQHRKLKSEFISVEIAIDTDYEADDFIAYFERQDIYVAKIDSMGDHKWYIYFAPDAQENANNTILDLCRQIEELPRESRRDWDMAAKREFFAGYHVGGDPHAFTEHLDAETLKRVLNLNAGIGYALYPAPPVDED
jgi:hypothetical protein